MQALVAILWGACGLVAVTDYDRRVRRAGEEPDISGRLLAYVLAPIFAPLILVDGFRRRVAHRHEWRAREGLRTIEPPAERDRAAASGVTIEGCGCGVVRITEYRPRCAPLVRYALVSGG